MDKVKKWRYKKTISFLSKHCPPPENILDLGVENELSKQMTKYGYNVTNTQGENLDLNFDSIKDSSINIVTAFEIFEHMLAPFNILREIKSKKLIASVPLKLWFANAYWNEIDDFDKHYHEFEIKQFNFLLKKTGWKIIDFEKWIPPVQRKIGLRTLLRMFTFRYYIVYCERI